MRYVPGGRLGALYAPASSVTRLRDVPLSTSVIVIDAPGINAPDGSEMFPRMRPVFPCGNAGSANTKTTAIKPTFFKNEVIGPPAISVGPTVRIISVRRLRGLFTTGRYTPHLFRIRCAMRTEAAVRGLLSP